MTSAQGGATQPYLSQPLASLQGGHAAMAPPAGEENSTPLRRHRHLLRPQPGAAGPAGMFSPAPAAAPGRSALKDYNSQCTARRGTDPLKSQRTPLLRPPSLPPISGGLQRGNGGLTFSALKWVSAAVRTPKCPGSPLSRVRLLAGFSAERRGARAVSADVGSRWVVRVGARWMLGCDRGGYRGMLMHWGGCRRGYRIGYQGG